MTPCWRKVDSNHRSLSANELLWPEQERLNRRRGRSRKRRLLRYRASRLGSSAMSPFHRAYPEYRPIITRSPLLAGPVRDLSCGHSVRATSSARREIAAITARGRADSRRPPCCSTSCVICGNSGCHSASRSSAAGVATGDKTMRLHAQTAMIENGFVLLPMSTRSSAAGTS